MDPQPWKFNDKGILDFVRKCVEGNEHIEIAVCGEKIILGEDGYREVWDFSTSIKIARGQATINDWDQIDLAKELGARPFTDEEIDAELRAISEGMKQQKKEFEEGRFP